MKKIFLLFFVLFSFSYSDCTYDYHTEFSYSISPVWKVCPTGKYLTLINVFDPVPQKTLQGCSSVIVEPTIGYSSNQKVVFSSVGKVVYKQINFYGCQDHSSCPAGQLWDVDTQACVSSCASNQLQLLDGTCFDFCDPLDVYQDHILTTGIELLLPNNPLNCVTPDNISEDTCKAHSDKYVWVCNDDTAFTRFVDMLLGTSGAGHCSCQPNGLTPVMGPMGPIGSPLKNATRVSTPLLEDLLKKFPQLQNLQRADLDNWIDYISRNSDNLPKNSNNVPNPYGKNYDYIDTVITTDPNGKPVYTPVFEITDNLPGSTNLTGINISDNAFNQNLASSGLLNTNINDLMPNYGSSSLSPSAYQAAVQTATREQFILPEPTQVGQVVPVSTQAATSITARETVPVTYPMTITSMSPTSTTYQGSNNDVNYKITAINNLDGSVTHDVTADMMVDNFPSQLRYRYTLNGSVGTMSSTTGGLTYTNPTTGETYTNPESPINYNYQPTSQNFDELLNFKPEITETTMDKPLRDLVTEQEKTFDFIDSIKNSIIGLKSDFDGMIAKLENPPKLLPKNGNCEMSVFWHGYTIVANPCTPFYAYREMISLFLTIVGMFFVAKFAVENLK